MGLFGSNSTPEFGIQSRLFRSMAIRSRAFLTNSANRFAMGWGMAWAASLSTFRASGRSACAWLMNCNATLAFVGFRNSVGFCWIVSLSLAANPPTSCDSAALRAHNNDLGSPLLAPYRQDDSSFPRALLRASCRDSSAISGFWRILLDSRAFSRLR